MRALISLPEADFPFNSKGALLELLESNRRMIRLGLPFAPFNSISICPSCLSFLTNDLRSCARFSNWERIRLLASVTHVRAYDEARYELPT